VPQPPAPAAPPPAESEFDDLEIAPASVKELFARKEIVLVDVREQHEWDAGHIEGARHIPMSQIQERIGELQASDAIVVYCHAGMRSLDVTAYMRESGYGMVKSMSGGYSQWCADCGK